MSEEMSHRNVYTKTPSASHSLFRTLSQAKTGLLEPRILPCRKAWRFMLLLSHTLGLHLTLINHAALQ
jgi:hypothetical protein